MTYDIVFASAAKRQFDAFIAQQVFHTHQGRDLFFGWRIFQLHSGKPPHPLADLGVQIDKTGDAALDTGPCGNIGNPVEICQVVSKVAVS